jgi:hypothetical protein
MRKRIFLASQLPQGQLLYYHMGLFHVQETGTMLLAMLLLVGLLDTCSNLLRTRAMPWRWITALWVVRQCCRPRASRLAPPCPG